ncbi:MAG TPA: family 1 glycosylhydrolase [Polyangia bacterium]|nr:family 1 glycosylhydrolase [Polyangia bacterium]
MKRPCRRGAGAAALLAAAAMTSGGCRDGLRFDPAAVAAHPMLRGAPRGFLLGPATSAYQTEGGNRNDWTDWEKGRYPEGTPHVADGLTADRLDDSWNRWPQDVAALRLLGANVYRLGVEWSRFEPAEGTWDQAAADRYRAMFAALRAAHIAPFVTLYHFTLPTWIAARGGWEWAGTPAALAAFAGRAGAAFGDLVDWWCTINEPNVLVAKSYLAGQWPPGVRDPARGARVMAALMRAHGLMTAALRAADRADADGDGRPTRIGIAQNLRIFDPASAGPLDGLAAGIADGFYDESFLDAVTLGRVRVVLPGVADIDEPFPALAGSFDYLGINYYTRDRVEARLSGAPPYRALPTGDRPHSDLGWEIYPEGLYRLLVRYAHRGWPLLVTENGLADAGGQARPDFLRAHLYAVDRALADGVDVRGYIFWSLMDNFEWSHGARGRFGLFTVDFSDPALSRRPTAAVATFREAARNLGSD